MKWGGKEKKGVEETIILPDTKAVIVFPYEQGKLFDPDFFFWKKVIDLYPNELFIIPKTVKLPFVYKDSLRIAILPSRTTKGFLLQARKIVPNLALGILIGADIQMERIIKNFEEAFPRTKYKVIIAIAPKSWLKKLFSLKEKVLLELNKLSYILGIRKSRKEVFR